MSEVFVNPIIALCVLKCMRMLSGFFLSRPLFPHPHATSLALKWLVLLWRRTSTSSVCLSCRRQLDVVRQSSKFSTHLFILFYFFAFCLFDILFTPLPILLGLFFCLQSHFVVLLLYRATKEERLSEEKRSSVWRK